MDKRHEVLPKLKNKNLKINNILIKRYKDMLEFPGFEQNCYSRTAEIISEIGHDSLGLLKCLACYDTS